MGQHVILEVLPINVLHSNEFVEAIIIAIVHNTHNIDRCKTAPASLIDKLIPTLDDTTDHVTVHHAKLLTERLLFAAIITPFTTECHATFFLLSPFPSCYINETTEK